MSNQRGLHPSPDADKRTLFRRATFDLTGLPLEDGSKGAGRSHQTTAFASVLAGGGVKAGFTYGATDELGLRAVEKPVHVNDFHATILHLMGLDHERLTYRHLRRDFRLTDVRGSVVTPILA